MAKQLKYCFVAMPFRPELNFFYLFIQQYLEQKHGLRVERGDARVLTKPLMDKIRDQILRADLVIGDITGGNANVFYEIGLAHAAGKPVLFLTQDKPENVPVDLRPFDSIQYDLTRDKEFLAELDTSISAAFGLQYEALREQARLLLQRFNRDTGLSCVESSPEEFQTRVRLAERTDGIPAADQEALLAQFLLPKIIRDISNTPVIQRYTQWLSATFP